MDSLSNYLANANVQAFLRVIRAGETSQDDTAYRTVFGGGTFESFADHPRRVVSAAGLTSTAAGAYQFLARTWDSLVSKYHFPDFSPHSQDLGALALIRGRHALDDVVAGNFDTAIAKCNPEWASLPGSPYGQPTRTLEQARKVYEAYGGTYLPTQAPEAPVAPTKDSHMIPLPLISLAIDAIGAFMPKVRELFPPGSEVADRNVKTAEAIIGIAKSTIGAVNEQDLVTKLKEEPDAANKVEKAVQENWFGIVEIGGGIPEARKASLEMTKAGVSFWSSPAFVISLLLIVPVYAVIASVLGLIGTTDWDQNVKMLIVGLISNVVSGVMGFWLGSSFGSQKKTDALAIK